MPASLASLGVGLWPGHPRPEATALVLCRQSLSVAAGTADGSVWLWRLPPAWHPFPKVGRQGAALFDAIGGDAGDGPRPLALLCGQHDAPITSMVTACEGKDHVLLSADSSGCMCVWRLSDGVCLKTGTVLSWGPREMVNVSCKGKALIACCGPSPDIEVIDLSSMKRIVRLFGHGDWCTALCVRTREALMELDIQSSREPSIYSLDQGGTLCVWLAERSCSPHMVGWVPSVQCHRVAVLCPTSLVLDKHCALLMVVGRDAAAHYRLGRDHRLSDKAAPPTIFSFSEFPRTAEEKETTDAQEAEASDPGADTAAPREKAGAKAPETAAQRRARRLAVASGRGAAELSGNGTVQARWTLSRMRGVLGPGGERALVWRPHDALLLLRHGGACEGSPRIERLVSRATVHVAAFCSDPWGWFALISDEGDVSVWSAEEQLGPARHLSGASALRTRYAAENGSSSSPAAPASAAASDGGTSGASGASGLVKVDSGEWKTHAMIQNGSSGSAEAAAGRGAASCAGEGGESVGAEGSRQAGGAEQGILGGEPALEGGVGNGGNGRHAPAGYDLLALECKFQGQGWLREGFDCGLRLRQDLRAVAAAKEAAWVAPLGGGANVPGGEGAEGFAGPRAAPAAQKLSMGEVATAAIIHVAGPVPSGLWTAQGGRQCGSTSRRSVGSRWHAEGKGGGGERTLAGVYWVVGYSTGAVSVMGLPSGEVLLRLEAPSGAVLSLLWVEGEDLLVAGVSGVSGVSGVGSCPRLAGALACACMCVVWVQGG